MASLTLLVYLLLALSFSYGKALLKSHPLRQSRTLLSKHRSTLATNGFIEEMAARLRNLEAMQERLMPFWRGDLSRSQPSDFMPSTREESHQDTVYTYTPITEEMVAIGETWTSSEQNADWGDYVVANDDSEEQGGFSSQWEPELDSSVEDDWGLYTDPIEECSLENLEGAMCFDFTDCYSCSYRLHCSADTNICATGPDPAFRVPFSGFLQDPQGYFVDETIAVKTPPDEAFYGDAPPRPVAPCSSKDTHAVYPFG